MSEEIRSLIKGKISLEREIDKLKAENKTLKDALEFYADHMKWVNRDYGLDSILVVADYSRCTMWGVYGGKRARQALEKIK